jgi:hypothetical protein
MNYNSKTLDVKLLKNMQNDLHYALHNNYARTTRILKKKYVVCTCEGLLLSENRKLFGYISQKRQETEKVIYVSYRSL